MKKYDALWHDVNNLLAFLRSGEVPRLVKEYYTRFNNNAPVELLNTYIERLQESLDSADE